MQRSTSSLPSSSSSISNTSTIPSSSPPPPSSSSSSSSSSSQSISPTISSSSSSSSSSTTILHFPPISRSPLYHSFSFFFFLLFLHSLLLDLSSAPASAPLIPIPIALHYTALHLFFAIAQILLFFWLLSFSLAFLHLSSIDYSSLFSSAISPAFESLLPDSELEKPALPPPSLHPLLIPSRLLHLASHFSIVASLSYFVTFSSPSAPASYLSISSLFSSLGLRLSLSDPRFPPVLLLFLLVVSLFLPSSRSHTLRRVLSRLLASLAVCLVWPFLGFDFSLLLLSDLLTSACLCLFDLSLVCCTFASLGRRASLAPFCASALYEQSLKPLACFLPLWIRLVQCLYLWSQRSWALSGWDALQHPANACKYLSAIVVVALSALAPYAAASGSTWWRLIVAAQVAKTLLSVLWDVAMDWDLGRWPSRGAQEFPVLLRRRRLFHHTWLYYWLIVSNLLGRLTWVFFYFMESTSPYWQILAVLCEILRRGQWMIFRIEAQLAKNLN